MERKGSVEARAQRVRHQQEDGKPPTMVSSKRRATQGSCTPTRAEGCNLKGSAQILQREVDRCGLLNGDEVVLLDDGEDVRANRHVSATSSSSVTDKPDNSTGAKRAWHCQCCARRRRTWYRRSRPTWRAERGLDAEILDAAMITPKHKFPITMCRPVMFESRILVMAWWDTTTVLPAC